MYLKEWGVRLRGAGRFLDRVNWVIASMKISL